MTMGERSQLLKLTWQVLSLTELSPQPRTEVISPRSLELILSPSFAIRLLGGPHKATDKALSASRLLSSWVSFSGNCHYLLPTGYPGLFDSSPAINLFLAAPGCLQGLLDLCTSSFLTPVTTHKHLLCPSQSSFFFSLGS